MSLAESEFLLEKLLEDPPLGFKHAYRLDVLVICAGSFPSFPSFVKVLRRLYPGLKNIYFTLVEPSQDKTDLFKKTYSSVNFEIYNTTLGNFLKVSDGKCFDIIYFEHPDMRILPIFLNKLFYIFLKTVSLRASIAYLPIVFKEETLLIASNMSKNENRQLSLLLKLCFNTQPAIFDMSCIRKNLFQPFSHGLYTKLKNKNNKQNEEKNALLIQKSDQYFFMVTLLFLFVFGEEFISSRSIFEIIFPLLLIVCLFFYYCPGRKGMVCMVIFMIIQIAILV